MRTLVFLVFLLGIATIGLGQQCNVTLKGTVKDFHDNSILEGATVVVVGTNQYAVTDENGYYQLQNLCPGKIEVEVSHISCNTRIEELEITEDTTQNFSLEHHFEALKEVKVIGDAVHDKTNSSQEASITAATLDENSAGNLGDILKNVSGITTLNTGASIVKPSIHGLNGSRVLILNDGVRMQDMEWGDEHAPNVDPNSIGNIRVIKGASALQYGGDALGGVIVMDQNTFFNRDTLYGKTIINGISNGRGGNITTKLTKVFDNHWHISANASLKKLGDQEAPNYILSNTGVQEAGFSINMGRHGYKQGFNAKYAYFDTEIGILRASHIGSVGDLILAINNDVPLVINDFTHDINNPKQKVNHHLSKLEYYRRFKNLGKLNFQYDFQQNNRQEFDVRRGENANRASVDLELTTHTTGLQMEWVDWGKFELQTGLMGRYQENFPDPSTQVRRLIPDYDKYDAGFYNILTYKVNEKWTLDAGLRYDFSHINAQKFYITTRWEQLGYDQEFGDWVVEDFGNQLLTNPTFDFHNISATVGAKFSPSNFDSFKVNYAMAQRAPNPSELFSEGLHHSASRIELGDLRINSETSHKIAIAKERDYNFWGYALEPYYNYIQDFILLEPSGVEFTTRGAFPVWSYRQTNLRLLGLDVSAYANWSNYFKTNHMFSIVKAKDLEQNGPVVNIPSARTTNSITYKNAKLNQLEVALSSNYVFRQNETPENLFVYSPREDQQVEVEINNAPNAYHLLNFSTKIQFSLSEKTQLTTSLMVNNVLDTSYRDYLNRQRYFADDLGRNFILQLKLNY
ncbi:TonB-dependent receptor [Croceivirga sp. JEA036]|uniref:TonB-dependent receptor n=1 Tax=Croceivirga sp. JEA036 TaxID=2721162 RepID=UPI001439839B|nr:TonB-dependent receptor [Croceivirga sp. JEA036]NJB35540.1 TonB-dependent receptor [Croceivirga sp. JEA036]